MSFIERLCCFKWNCCFFGVRKWWNTKLLVLINWNTQVNNCGEIAVVKSSTYCHSLVMWSVIRRWSRHNKRHAMFQTDHVSSFEGLLRQFWGLYSIWSHRVDPVELSLLRWEIGRFCFFYFPVHQTSRKWCSKWFTCNEME